MNKIKDKALVALAFFAIFIIALVSALFYQKWLENKKLVKLADNVLAGSDKSMKEISIIGAGPVGLWTAIQIKLANPDVQVKIFEKHRQYQRSHGLWIKLDSLDSVNNNKNEILKNWIAELKESIRIRSIGEGTKAFMEKGFHEGKKEWLRDFKKFTDLRSVFIRTNEIEEKLKSIAADLGVQIEYKEIKDSVQLLQLTKDSKVVIGADGSKSLIREQIFACGTREHQLQYVVELKFDIVNKGEDLNLRPFAELYKTEKLLNFLAQEHISTGKKTDSANRHETLRFFVDQKTFEAMGDITFKNPKNLKDHFKDLPEKLKQDISCWFAAREHCGKKIEFQPSQCKISKIPLSSYISEKIHTNQDGKHFVLVGDAAGAVPYFRALNCGLICGTKLSWRLSSFFKDNNQSHLQRYETDAKSRITMEMGGSFLKNAGLRVVDAFVQASSMVPWQTNLWGKSDKAKIDELARDFERKLDANPSTSISHSAHTNAGNKAGPSKR